MREAATVGTNVDFRVIHGASDAPTVDVIARNVATLVNDASYSNITPYLTVPANNYVLDVTPGNNNSVIVASFSAPLTGLAGQSAVVLASGFLTPSTNQNGAAFGLLAVLVDGTAFMLSNVTSIAENPTPTSFTMFPNPASDILNINSISDVSNTTLEILNAVGQVVKTDRIIDSNLTVSLKDFSAGIYFVKLSNEKGQTVSKLIVE
jgi:hypothetical protein